MTRYIVTGSSSGLGFEIAKRLVLAGKNVLGISRTRGKSDNLLRHDNFSLYQCDLSLDSDFEAVGSLIECGNDNEIILVLNAGVFDYQTESETNIISAKEMFNINYFSAISLINRFVQRGLTRVFFVNSISGIIPQSGQGQYSASKHALQAYSEVLAKESIHQGFDVMTINPGGINSELWQKTNILDNDVTEKFLDPEDLANVICTLLSLPKETYIRSMIILPRHDV